MAALVWLVALFGILSVVFGVWGFAFAAGVVWFGIKILFWVFLALFVVSLIGWMAGPRQTYP